MARPTLPASSGDVDITIIIAHRGSAMGLWMTIHSCEIDLANSGLKHNYVIVSNGAPELHWDEKNIFHNLERAGKLRDRLHNVQPLSPPSARQLATESADGKYLFFFDNHCMVVPGYFRRAISTMESYGADELHSTTRFYNDDKYAYHYRLSLEKDFWTAGAEEGLAVTEPYQIAMGGHGGFVVKRSVWEEVGGYGPIGQFDGYGGEESYLDLKMGMMGKSVWLDPQLIHYHYHGQRGYERHHTDDYYRNMMTCALIIGGDKWMQKVYMNFLKSSKLNTGKGMFENYMDAVERGRSHSEWLASRCKYSLDELLALYRNNNVPH